MMIAIRDIIIFLSGAALVYVYYLTQRYFYGKRIIVSGLTQKEEPFKARKINTELPEVDANRFNKLVNQINTHDEFAGTHSKAARESLNR